jgi:hypothetical protein
VKSAPPQATPFGNAVTQIVIHAQSHLEDYRSSVSTYHDYDLASAISVGTVLSIWLFFRANCEAARGFCSRLEELILEKRPGARVINLGIARELSLCNDPVSYPR